MAAHIDFRTLPVNVPSLCIPRVYSNIDEARIRCVFAELDMGDIQRIDVIGKTNDKGDKFNRVFVHFKQWNASENANIARERLLNGKEIKILYDDPWFWKVSAYREPARPSGAKQSYAAHRPQKKASIQFDFDDTTPPAHASPVNTSRRNDSSCKPRAPKEAPNAQQVAAQSRWSNRSPPPAAEKQEQGREQEQESIDL
jgi:hypothetical protein